MLTERDARRLDPLEIRLQKLPRLAEDRLEHLFLRTEVVIEQPVRDARLLGDVADARSTEALTREDAHRRIEQLAPPVRDPLRHEARSIISGACSRSPASR